MYATKKWSAALAVLALAYLAGCGRTPDQTGAKEDSGPKVSPASVADSKDDDDHEHGDKEGHSHDGWWCDEHGVPEEKCGQCSSKLAADFKKKGDWCDKHDRPDSQCFVCHPEKATAFATLYEKKYGKKPPAIE